jgi:enterobactin synthetase component D
MRACRNPATMPAFVAQHSILLEPSAGEQRMLEAAELPPQLGSAALKRKLEFAAGRHCARAAIKRLAPGRPAPDIAIAAGGLPSWPEGIVGSITHAGGFVSAAVARREDALSIGIDSESLVTKAVALEIASLVATPSELAAAMAETRLQDNDALTLLFSAKEAVFKCLYPLTGLFFAFLDIEVTAAAAQRSFAAHVPAAYLRPGVGLAALTGAFELDGLYCHTGIALVA